MKHLESALPNSHAIVFGPFRLSPIDRSVYAYGERVAIGGKAYQILLLLVSHPNEVIPAERFNQQLWPDTPNVDINLRVQIASLRKALAQYEGGNQCIQNVSGRGYKFAGKALYEESFVGSSEGAIPELTTDVDRHAAPQLRTFSVKDSDLHAVGRLLAAGPVTTLVGVGGVGKTALALHAMRHWCALHSMDAVFVDLSSIPTPAHVQGALVAALTPSLPPNAPPEAALDLLRGKRLLIVLDCCEHVIDAAASLADTLVRTTGAKVLATSREPLRVDGESVHRVLPLSFPESPEDRSGARRFAAAQLFEDLARAAGSPLAMDDAVTSQIGQVCALLDGLPLAIELAAACLSGSALSELIEQLVDNPLALLTRGRRNAPMRHKSMRLSIDWSYDALTAQEQRLCRFLSVFDGPFTLADAHAVFRESDGDLERDTRTLLLTLIDKSLVSVEPRTTRSTFSMLKLVRSHGLEKLVEHKERDMVRRRHAQHLIHTLTEPGTYQSSDTSIDPLADHPVTFTQVRRAFAWLPLTDGASSLELTLAWAAYDLYVDNAEFDEYRHVLERLLARLPEATEASADNAFRLNFALGRICLLCLPAQDDSARRALKTALSLARHHGDHERVAQTVSFLVRAYLAYGDYEESRRLVVLLHRDASTEKSSSGLYEQSMAMVQLKRGNLSSAGKHFRKMRDRAQDGNAKSGVQTFDRRSRVGSQAARICEAQMLWLSGHVKSAYAAIDEIVQLAQDADTASLCEALAESACLIACWNGDARSLQKRYRELTESIEKAGTDRWKASAQCFGLCVNGAPFDQSPLPRISLDPCEPALHDMLATVNRHFLTPYAVDRAKSGKAGYSTPEIYRTLGENLLTRGSTPCSESEALFKDALSLSRRHGSAFWELRAAISLAKLRRRALESYEALDILSAALEKIPDPEGAADAVLARSLITDISQDIQGKRQRVWLGR